MENDSKKLSNFHLSRSLHQGAKCELFEARYTQAGGVVQAAVVKRLRPEFACVGFELRAFLAEIEWARTLSHSCFPRIIEAGEQAGRYYLAMERIDGWTLSELLRNLAILQVTLPTQVALTWLHQLTAALASMHEAKGEGFPTGAAHLSVAPTNIMMRKKAGAAALLDFGGCVAIASPREAASRAEEAAFCAPESLEAKPVDGRADLFSLGRVMASMTKRMNAADLNGALAALIKKCCSDQPGQRFANARLLMAAIEDVLLGQSTQLSDGVCANFASEVFGTAIIRKDPRAQRPRQAGPPLNLASEGLETVFFAPAQTDVDIREPACDEDVLTEPEHTSSPAQKFVNKHRAVTVAAAPGRMEALASRPLPADPHSDNERPNNKHYNNGPEQKKRSTVDEDATATRPIPRFTDKKP